jgi:hypothetical protein
MSLTITGEFTPKHPEKYVSGRRGKKKIIYRSSWEREFNKFLDNNPNVIQWSSEEIGIPYVKPTSRRHNKVHIYYPDYWVKYKNKRGEIIQEIIEVKPIAQVNKPSTVGKKKMQQLREAITWEINKAKWKAATDYCNKYGMKFRIVSENKMFR